MHSIETIIALNNPRLPVPHEVSAATKREKAKNRRRALIRSARNRGDISGEQAAKLLTGVQWEAHYHIGIDGPCALGLDCPDEYPKDCADDDS